MILITVSLNLLSAWLHFYRKFLFPISPAKQVIHLLLQSSELLLSLYNFKKLEHSQSTTTETISHLSVTVIKLEALSRTPIHSRLEKLMLAPHKKDK